MFMFTNAEDLKRAKSRRVVRRKAKPLLGRDIATMLLKLEPLGVLTREMCYSAEPLDGELDWDMFPPRLFYFPKYLLLVHVVGTDGFYEANPEYSRGGISKECYILEEIPLCLSNYFALEEMGRSGPAPKEVDPVSLEARRPPPLTKADIRSLCRAARESVKAKAARVHRLRVVKAEKA